MLVLKEIPAEKSDEVGQRPVAFRLPLEELDQQERQKSCPKLDFECVAGSSEEGLDLEVLLKRLEEEFDLPAVAVDFADGVGGEFLVVGQEFDSIAGSLVLHHNAAQAIWAKIPATLTGKLYDLVGQDAALLARRDWQGLDDVVGNVGFQATDEVNAIACPASPKLVIDVSAVDDDDRTCGKRQSSGDLDVGAIGLGDVGIGRPVAVVVE